MHFWGQLWPQLQEFCLWSYWHESDVSSISFFYILASVIIIFRSAADKGSSSLPHQAPSEPRESGKAKERGTGQHHNNAVSGVQGCCTGQRMWDF